LLADEKRIRLVKEQRAFDIEVASVLIEKDAIPAFKPSWAI